MIKGMKKGVFREVFLVSLMVRMFWNMSIITLHIL